MPRTRTAIAFLGIFLLVSAPLGAQDVLHRGEEAGVEPPAWILEVLAADPDAFEFERAWKAKARRVVSARDRIGPLLGPSYGPEALSAAGAVMTGTLAFPVILTEYTDVPEPFASSAYHERLFGGGSGAVSVTDYYSEISDGVFTMEGTLSGWLPMPGAADDYEGPPGARGNARFGEVGAYVSDALAAADPGMDFSQFDNDGPDGIPNSGDDDGFVDVTAFLYPTVAASCGSPNTGIWPHRWTVSGARSWNPEAGSGPFVTDDPSANGGTILVDDYIVQSGIQCDGTSLMGSGTMSHELGHAIDLPDLYDIDGGSEGIGHWGLMGSGNWNRQMSPAHMSAWSKDMMGWVDVTTVTSDQSLVLDPIQTSRDVIRVDAPGSGQYFLLANRQALGSDQHLHGPGLLVWHIDPSRAGLLSEVSNSVNADEERKGVDLEEADGLDELDLGRAEGGNRGDAEDPFPAGNDEFSARTHPDSRTYVPGTCSIAVRNIQAGPGNAVSFDLVVAERWVLWGDADGSGELDGNDRDQTYWFALGLRDASQQTFIDNGDVDGDGDVDVADGFILESHLNNVSTGGHRVGEEAFLACEEASPPASEGVGHPGPSTGR